ncbi:MAG: peptide deformylase [Phycisphaerae bacterium]|nr:MAG: peptide deformylase [Phycisphaerae bacterium]
MLDQIDIDSLVIVKYPSPVLRKKCEPIATFDGSLGRLVERMCELMHAQKGVGLAGPQVGLPLRIFVWNATGSPDGDRVSVNPILSEFDGQVDAEEGCLSIPDVNVSVKRAVTAKMVAFDATGLQYEVVGQDLMARIWQHENDHLDGRLILDYQSPGEEIAHRKVLKELTATYKKANPSKKAQTSKRSTSTRGRRR